MIPVAHQVASKLYNYEEVSYKATASTAPNINGRCLPSKFFNPLECAGSLPFKSIMSKEKGKSTWPSYSAKGLPALVGDMEAVACVHREGKPFTVLDRIATGKDSGVGRE
eukprot:1694430-Amphidinium_carterae.1